MVAFLLIEQVDFLDNYTMEILLSDGKRVYFDMKSKLDTMRFIELQEEKIFQSGRVIGGQLIRWDNNIEISLEEVLQQGRIGTIVNKEVKLGR